MAIDTASIQTFTDSELLVLWRAAIAAISTGQSYSIGGRQLNRTNLSEAREMVDWLEARIQEDANAAAGTGGNAAVIQFNDPQ